MDAVEYLTGRRLKMHEVYTSEISISFCASARIPGKSLLDSLRSINIIANETGFPYEIILVSPPGNKQIRDSLKSILSDLDNFYILKQNTSSNGHAMRMGFESSSNRFFIPFNADLVYDIRYADLIHSFLMKREKKLFLSELPVIHRDLITDVGGYRDLSHGHDIDLYSRIAMMYGVVAYPAMFNRIPLVSPPPSEDTLAGTYGRGHSSIRMLMDHIIACNYDVDDLMVLYTEGRGQERLTMRIYFSILYAISRISRVKPYRFDRNNYLILMENVFESLVLKDFARYGMEDVKANMMLTKEEINYLKARSRLYRDVIYSINQYVIEV